MSSFFHDSSQRAARPQFEEGKFISMRQTANVGNQLIQPMETIMSESEGEILQSDPRFKEPIFSFQSEEGPLNHNLSFEGEPSPRFTPAEKGLPVKSTSNLLGGVRLNLNARPFEIQEQNQQPIPAYTPIPPGYPLQVYQPVPAPPGFQYSSLPMQHQPAPPSQYQVYLVAVPVNPYMQNAPIYPQPMPVFYPPQNQSFPPNNVPPPPGFEQMSLNQPAKVEPPQIKSYSSAKKEFEQLSTLSPLSAQTPLRPADEFSLSFSGSNPKRRLDFSSPHSKFVTPHSSGGKWYSRRSYLEESSSHRKNLRTGGSSIYKFHSKTAPSYVPKQPHLADSKEENNDRLWQSAASVLHKVELEDEPQSEAVPSIPMINELIKK